MKDLGQPGANPDKNNNDVPEKDKNDDANDLINYKGIYFDDDSGQKYQCPETGAHFEYLDMYRRLKKISTQRHKSEREERMEHTSEERQTEILAAPAQYPKQHSNEKVKSLKNLKQEEQDRQAAALNNT